MVNIWSKLFICWAMLFNTMFAVVKRKFIKIIKLNFKSVWIENRKGVIIKLVRLRKLR